MKTMTLSFVAIMGFGAVAVADINVGLTAEWLAHQSAVIAIAVPEEVENVKGPGQVWFTKTRFALNDVIKGPQSAGDKITVYDFSYNTNDVLRLAEAVKTKKALLVFCAVAEHLFKEIDGRYVFTEAHIFKSAYYQDAPVTKLYTPEFCFLTDFADLQKRVRSQATYEADLVRRYWRGNVLKGSKEVPFDSEFHRSLYAGSTCYLWVPEYKEAQKDAPTKPSTATK
jgi:hypothetical protein